MSKAFILHKDLITAIGIGYEENLVSLQKGRSAISFPDLLETIHHLPVGEIKRSNDELRQLAGVRTEYPRTALLSLIAASGAWQPFKHKTGALRVAVVSANTVGGMDKTEKYYQAFKAAPDAIDPEEIRYHECGALTEILMDELGLTCWSATISTACSSSANSLMMAARLIEQDHYDLILAGGADSLSRFTLNGFNSLMILDKEQCCPFDRDRRGLNLGEGAAYLVLGNEKACNQFPDLKPEAILSGYANANDAHHQTASSPEGKGNRLAMEAALRKAQLQPNDISYINLHGTGTENNDASEGAAIQSIFGTKVPAASSTKAFTGHTLGAAGAVEAIFSLMALAAQSAWPNLRFNHKIENLNWTPVGNLTPMSIRHVLSNSFGFGGNCSTLIFSGCQ